MKDDFDDSYTSSLRPFFYHFWYYFTLCFVHFFFFFLRQGVIGSRSRENLRRSRCLTLGRWHWDLTEFWLTQMSRVYCVLRYALTCHTFFIRRYRIVLFLAFLVYFYRFFYLHFILILFYERTIWLLMEIGSSEIITSLWSRVTTRGFAKFFKMIQTI